MNSRQTMTTRTLARVIESVPTSDGAGVKLRRSLGRVQELRLDPFLMLDEFSSEDPKCRSRSAAACAASSCGSICRPARR